VELGFWVDIESFCAYNVLQPETRKKDGSGNFACGE
jgi:hypothetical protein